MTPETHFPSEIELQLLAERLSHFRSTLRPDEQHLLDAILLAAAGEDGECTVQGKSATVRHAAE